MPQIIRQLAPEILKEEFPEYNGETEQIPTATEKEITNKCNLTVEYIFRSIQRDQGVF